MSAIFISHSKKDHADTETMARWLKEQGYTSYFIDYDEKSGISAGTDWEQVLYQHLRKCQAIVALVTPDWLESKWCFAEMIQAREKGKPIFPVIAKPCQLPDLLSDTQKIDLVADPEGGYRRLVFGLKEHGLDPSDVFDWDFTRPPYPGFPAFEEDDAAVFFGRSAEILSVRETFEGLRRHGRDAPRLVLILGSSGSGKSSLVRAGLIPRLKKDEKNWLPLRPFRPQDESSPLDALVFAIADTYKDLRLPCDSDLLRSRLRSAAESTPVDSGELLKIARELASAADRREATILVTVDQAEELLNSGSPGTGKAFLQFLGASLSADDQHLMAVATLRSDSLGGFQNQVASLDSAYRVGLEHRPLTVEPIPIENYRDLIEGPARLTGLDLEDRLVFKLLADGGQPDSLPLLAFTLRRLYDLHFEDPQAKSYAKLTLQEYEKLGGLAGAVQNAAERIFGERDRTIDEINAFREAFIPGLIRYNEDRSYSRRRAFWHNLPTGASSLLDGFVDARILVAGADSDGQRTVEIAHEALLRTWPTLITWLIEDRDKLRQYNAVVRAAKEWDEGGQKSDLLVHRDGRLKDATKLISEQRFAFLPGSVEHTYLDACVTDQQAREAAAQEEGERRVRDAQRIAQEEAKRAQAEAERAQEAEKFAKEQEEAASKLRRRAIVAAGAAVAALVLLVIAAVMWRRSELAGAEAARQALAAQSALTDSFFRTVGVSDVDVVPRDEREALWELAQLDRANAVVRDKLLNRWFGTLEGFLKGEARGGQGFQAVTGLNLEYHRLAISGAAELGRRLAAALENPQETDSKRLLRLGSTLAALAAKMEPQAAVEIAKGLAAALENPHETDFDRLSSLADALAAAAAKMGPQPATEIAQGLATALKEPQETDPYRLSSLGRALAAVAAKMEPQAAAEIAQGLAAALEKPQEVNFSRLSSLGSALAAVAAKMEPQAAVEIAQGLAAALEKPQEMYSYRLSSLAAALTQLAAKMEPQAAAEIAQGLAAALEKPQETDPYRLSSLADALATAAAKIGPQLAAEIAQRLAAALENPQETDPYRLSSLGRALAAVAAKMEPQAAAEIAGRGTQRLAAALENPHETDFSRLSSLGSALAAVAAKMEPQAAAKIAQGFAAALEKPQETYPYRLSSLGAALAAVAAKMEPQAAAEIAQGLAAALENPQEMYPERLSSLGAALAAVAAKMEPQAAAEIAQGLAAALEKLQETNSARLSSLGSALAAVAAKMRPQAAAEIAQGLAVAMEQEMEPYRLSSLGSALTAVAAKMEPQAAAEIAQGLATAMEKPQETVSYRLSSLGSALVAVAAKMEPQAAAEMARRGAQRLAAALEQEMNPYLLSSLGDPLVAVAAKMEPQAAAEIAQGLATAMENPQETVSYRLSSLGSVLAAVAGKMEPLAAAEMARRGAQRLAAALENPQETDSERLWSLGNTLASLCTLLPSAHHAHLLALSNLLLKPVSKKAAEGEEQSNDRKLLATVCSQLPQQDLTEVLKYPFRTGEAEQIVLNELETKTGRKFDADVWKFVEQADALGIKDIGSPAQRPSAQDALKELHAL